MFARMVRVVGRGHVSQRSTNRFSFTFRTGPAGIESIFPEAKRLGETPPLLLRTKGTSLTWSGNGTLLSR